MSKTAPNNSLDKLQLGVTLAFKKGIAKKCGVNAAIVFNHILYWLDYNSPNPASHREGKIWMYETQEAMAEFFGFLSEKEVRNAIKILVDEGLLLKAHFHDDGWTKTNWYTVYDQELIDKSPVKKVSSKRPQGLIDTAPPGSSILPAGAHDHIREDKQEEKELIPNAVVVSSPLDKLTLSKSLRIKITKEYPVHEIFIAVERCLKWAGRPNDEVGIMTALKAQDWNDVESPEDIERKNKECLYSLRKYDNKDVGGRNCVVGDYYIEFIAGLAYDRYETSDKDFIEKVQKWIPDA